MAPLDKEGMRGSVEGYLGRSREMFDLSFLEYAEGEIGRLQQSKGFAFPTGEGMRKVTKQPEMRKLAQDPLLKEWQDSIRTTIRGIRPVKEGGLYAGVNAFHHGHIAYLSRSEAAIAVDMNKLVPYGFAFVVGLAGGARTPAEFKEQAATMHTNPQTFRDIFANTALGGSPLVEKDTDEVRQARDRLLRGVVSVMNEFDPLAHGQDKIPPVFCADADAYNYFRTLAVQDRIAGAKTMLQGEQMIGIIAKAISVWPLAVRELNTIYVSSCFDPRFSRPKERRRFIDNLARSGHRGIQIVESFLNSGWIAYEVNCEE